jgi:hypothetical protein
LGVKILKYFDEDPGWRQFGSGMEKVGSGMEKSQIRDKHPASATLISQKQRRHVILFRGAEKKYWVL